MKILLRPATPADDDFLYQVYCSSREQELSMVPWNHEQREAFLRMQFSAQKNDYLSRYPQGQHSVIFADGVRVGRLYLAQQENETKILDVTVLPEHRKKGIGTAILKDVLAAAGRSGKRVTIYVEVFNPSLKFFEELGFRRAEETGIYFVLEWCIPEGQR